MFFDEASDTDVAVWGSMFETAFRKRANLVEPDLRHAKQRARIGKGLPQLRDASWKRYGHKCPCCGVPMHGRAPKSGRSNPPNLRTIGHDVPVSIGGERARDRWVYICHRCNQQQEAMTFFAWARKLERDGDRRAARVLELADMIEEVAGPWLTTQRYGSR